jgi:hypothetical protein
MASNNSKGVFVGIFISLLIFFMLFFTLVEPNIRCGGPHPRGSPAPVNEMLTRITQAKTGLETTTSTLSLKASEGFSTHTLKGRDSELSSVTFECIPGSPVCEGNSKQLVISGDGSKLEALESARFSALIKCTKASSGDYDCTIGIRSPVD